jgi:hypothetical protein
MGEGYHPSKVQKDLLSYTGHEFKNLLVKEEDDALEKYRVNGADRMYQFWRKHAFSRECRTEKFFIQKLDYLHNNPCQEHWMLVEDPKDYRWSSAHFYETGETEFSWLRHYQD